MINVRIIIFINNVIDFKIYRINKGIFIGNYIFLKILFFRFKDRNRSFFVFCFLDIFYVKSGLVRWFDLCLDFYFLVSCYYFGSLILLY